jgi:hypothetical protein
MMVGGQTLRRLKGGEQVDYATKLEIAKQSMLNLKSFLYQQSVAFFTSKEAGNITLASGTLVSIGDRLFIATASHTVPEDPGTEIWVLSYEPRHSTDTHAPILNRGRCPKDDPDVGFLELGTGAAVDYLKKEVCPIERLAIRGIGGPLRAVLLVGSPGEYIKPKQHIEPGTSHPQPALVPLMITYYTIPMMESEWPSSENPDPEKDIFLDYPSTPGEQMETGEAMLLPKPHGMSGGGLWDQGFETSEIWTNASVKLIGIQSSWHPGLRYVRCVQIIHWLRLIHSHYEDMRPILERQFPELATGISG